jgi:hypothetical protein
MNFLKTVCTVLLAVVELGCVWTSGFLLLEPNGLMIIGKLSAVDVYILNYFPHYPIRSKS